MATDKTNPKILHVSTIAVTLSKFIAPIAQQLREMGCRVDAAASEISENQGCAQAFDHCHSIPFERKFLSKANLTVAMRTIRELADSEAYDLVHVHTPIASFVTRRALRNRKPDQKLVYTAHGFHFFDGASWLRNKLFATLEKSASKWMDHLIVINRQDQRNALKLGLATEQSLTYMSGIGIDLAKFQVPPNASEIRRKKLQELGIPQDSFVFLKVAGFTPNKKHCDAVRAFAKLPSDRRFDLLFAGDGTMRQETLQLAEQLGVADRVHFLGYRNDIKELVTTCDTMMLVSGREGLPCSVMEGMALGKTFVRTNIRGTSDLLADRVGLLVPAGAPDELARAMIESQTFQPNSEKLAERLQQCSLENIVEQHVQLYQQLLNWTPSRQVSHRSQAVTTRAS